MKKKPTTPPREPDFIARHGLVLMGLLWCVLRAWQWVFVPTSPQQDVTAYFTHASQWLDGLTPYVQFQLEYPPGALPVWVVPRFFASTFEGYRKAYAAWMLCFDAATLVLVCRATSSLVRGDAVANKRAQVSAGLLYSLATAMLGSLLLQRYDPVLGFLLMAWWVAAQKPQRRWWADVLLAVGIWVKLMAVLVVPVYWLYVWASDTRSQRKQGLVNATVAWVKASGWQRGAVLAGATAALFLPFYLKAGDQLGSFFAYHRDRGLQLETSYASFFLLLKPFLSDPVNVAAQFGAIEVVHPWTTAVAKGAGVLAAAGLLLTMARYAQHFWEGEADDQSGLLLDGATAMLLGFMGFNKVVSPQYLLWLAPLAAVVVQRGNAGERAWRLATMSVIFVATGLTWLFYYPQLFAMERWPSVVMAVRNIALVALWITLLWPHWPRLTAWWQRWNTPAVRTKASLGAAALLGAWAFCINLSPTPGDDVWLRLAEGAGIASQHRLTAFGVAENALAVPHAWVASALLYQVVQTLGNNAISWLGAVLACITAVLMAVTPSLAGRFSFMRLAALATAGYVVFLRTLNWPDAISLVLVATMVWALHHWRGGVKQLGWFLPLQVLFINTDPRAIIGPLLVAATGLATCIDARHRQRGVQLVGCAAAMVAVSCINPDGLAALGRGDVLFGNIYARTWMWQWASPFGQSIWSYWPWLFAAMLLFTALGLAARIGERPWVDAAQVLVAVALASQASTWVALAAVIVWPVLARGLDACLKLCAPNTDAPPWAAVAMGLVLLINAITYGYGVSDADHRTPLRDGMGGDLPYGAVDTLRDMHVHGTLFNEYTDGALVMNKLAPQLRPVLDSRVELYPPQLLQDYQSAYTDARSLGPFLERYHVTAVLLHKARAYAAVMQWLERDPHWVKVRDIDNRALFVRQS